MSSDSDLADVLKGAGEPILEEPPLKKRKRNEDDATSRRRNAKQAKRTAIAADAGLIQDENDIDEQKQVNQAVSRMNGSLFADFMARSVKRFQPELSLVELEDLRVPQSAFIDTVAWTGGRTQDCMPAFIESMTGLKRNELARGPPKKGAPQILVVCAAAIRAAELTRTMRCYQSKGGGSIAKLFAKHIKFKDAVDFVKKNKISLGVGTPQRINELMKEGALSLDHLRYIVVDGSWCGPKKRTLFEQPDSAVPAARLLSRSDLKTTYQEGKTSIIIF